MTDKMKTTAGFLLAFMFAVPSLASAESTDKHFRSNAARYFNSQQRDVRDAWHRVQHERREGDRTGYRRALNNYYQERAELRHAERRYFNWNRPCEPRRVAYNTGWYNHWK